MKCSYEKTCDGLSFQQRRYTDCDIMEITEYKRLVSSETEALQSKMTMAIDAAMNTIQTKQSELMMEIRSDPRKTAIRKRNITLRLEISHKQEISNKELAGALLAGPVAQAVSSATFLYSGLVGNIERKKK